MSKKGRHNHKVSNPRTIVVTFYGCVASLIGSPARARRCVLASHGGITEKRTCTCGAVQWVNVNGGIEERSNWSPPLLVDQPPKVEEYLPEVAG